MYCGRCGTQVPDQSKFCAACGLDLAATTPLAAVRAPSERTDVEIVRKALSEDYEVFEEIGRGGMAIVYRARERLLDREVAIKVLPFALAHDAEFVERFQREARTAAKLEHPHIVPVYRVGQRDSVIYFAMRFLRGKSLSEFIDERGALPPPVIRKLLTEASRALGYAHKHGIVHRDIKPDNIMFRENGEAVLCDFGIAKAATGTRLTGTGTAIGTPYYMSPEQARAQPLDGRSDLYSLGVVAYQCLTGHVPFDGEDSFSIGYKHVMEELETPQLSTDEERRLFAVITRMMAKDPGARYQAAEDLAAALAGGATGAGGALAPTGSRSAQAGAPLKFAPTPTTPMPRPSVEQLTGAGRKRRRPRAGALVGAFLALGAVGGGTYYALAVGDSSTEVADTPADSALVDLTTPPVGPDPVALGDSTTEGPAADSLPGADLQADPPPVVEQPQTGILTLAGEIGGNARIYIDGNSVAGRDHTVGSGSHRVRIERPGYRTFNSEVNVPAGQTVRLGVNMVAIPADPDPDPPPPEPASQCREFDIRTYNAASDCYDQAPAPYAAPLVPVPAGATTTPTPVILVLEIDAGGQVLQVTTRQPSNSPDFTIAAIEFAADMEYRPAMKDGVPVRAFKQEIFQPLVR